MEFLVESRSSGNHYTVKVTQEITGPALTCTCPAGLIGNFCKHRFAIIEGDASDVVRATHDVESVPALVSGTALEQAISHMRKQEKEIKDAQAELKKIKASVARIMQGSQERPKRNASIWMEESAGVPEGDSAREVSHDTRSLAGMTVVITGNLERLTRSEAKRLAEDSGAKISGAISRSTDILIKGKNPGSKLAKAQAHGTRIIDEAEFIAILGGLPDQGG